MFNIVFCLCCSVLTRCSHHGPQVAFEVTLSSCVDSQCGEFGVCREYFSGVHVFSTCTCIAGNFY